MKRSTHAFAILPSLFIAVSGAFADEVGFADLQARLGAATPTGAGVPVVQAEASESAGNYGPNQADGAFAGMIFTAMSGSPGNSSHATYVGYSWYGTGTGMGTGISQVWLYEAGNFAQSGYLRVGSGAGALPFSPPGGARVFNHSWIGSFGSAAFDNETLRRADYAMNRDDTLFICGENNGSGSGMQPLMSCNYNGIAVGLTSGGHSAGPPPAGIDGATRMKPELVAPGQFTSFSTPVVSAAASLMYETANTLPFSQNVNRRKNTTIKAALMAGATHTATWQNQTPASGASRGITAKPIDPIYGAGIVQVDRANRIISADEALGSATAGGATVQPFVGWDFEVATLNYQRHYRLDIPSSSTASVMLVWNRSPQSSQFNSGTPTPPNLRLELKQLVSGVPVAITGNAGVGIFDAGNVLSASAEDNVEHLYLKGLQAGSYLLSVTRDDALNTAAASTLAWIIEPAPVLGDINGDFRVDGADLGLLLGSWGLPGASDLNHDGTTDGADLGLLLGAWS